MDQIQNSPTDQAQKDDSHQQIPSCISQDGHLDSLPLRRPSRAILDSNLSTRLSLQSYGK